MIGLKDILKNRELVLGRNERYLDYIRPYNQRLAIKIVDDKVLTKKILKRNNIPVPKQIALIKDPQALKSFDFSTLPKSFVIKPVKGVRGGGVEIFYNKDKEGRWIKADGRKVTEKDLKTTMQDLLDGKYSLFNQPDSVLIEERVRPHKNFKNYTYKGTPDVRVIVFNKIPIMSYIRLPTRESAGKANLDLGAIGAGIDMAVGKTTSAIIGKSKKIEFIPGTTLKISGLKIPFWDRILRYAVEASKVTGLGFAAVDFLVDKEEGPMIVELNARPGLSIQLANDDGILWRLKKAGGIRVKSTQQGVRLAKDLFGGEIEEEIEAISGKQVIGLIENVKVYALNSTDKFEEIKAKIDTGADSSAIDKELAITLGFGDIIKELDSRNLMEDMPREESLKLMQELTDELKPKFEYLEGINYVKSSHGTSLRPSVKLKIDMDNVPIETTATISNRSHLEQKMIIGRKSLRSFLIDPSKK